LALLEQHSDARTRQTARCVNRLRDGDLTDADVEGLAALSVDAADLLVGQGLDYPVGPLLAEVALDVLGEQLSGRPARR
jgi:hypothetical protein